MDASALRERANRLRDSLGAEERSKKSEEIWKRLSGLEAFRRAGQALFYVSFKSEVDTSLMRALSRELGMDVAVPRGRLKDKSMAFHYLENEGSLESGPYGILQPPDDPATLADLSIPSVILVPGLVFDFKCNRLGWGAGYYDRFLSGPGRGLPSIGLGFECQLAEEVPVGPHDVPLDFLVTESRVLQRS
jgi:5-formyltetrahydrofolate cyclo-ligase